MSDRQTTIDRFLDTAANGDVEGFWANLSAINWPGAWRDIFAAFARNPKVHPNIPNVFRDAWCGAEGRGVLSERHRWKLTDDLEDNINLMAEVLRVLMPYYDTPHPYVMYRGQSATEYHNQRYGFWWTPNPTYAELYANNFFRRADCGPGVVIIAAVPKEAVIAKPALCEFIVDPRLVAEPTVLWQTPVRTIQDGSEMPIVSRVPALLGIPSGYETKALDQWFELGCPTYGIQSCRDQRLALLDLPIAA